MEFRLLYEGPLVAAASERARSMQQHHLRRQFHRQLRRLWSTHPNLLRLAQQVGATAASRAGQPAPQPHQGNLTFVRAGWSHLGSQWSRLGYDFLPLATLELQLRCSVEIQFLRPNQSGELIHAGELDPRIKILLAALRLPNSVNEVAASSPTPDEHPFFCLLQDTMQITEIKVSTDDLPLEQSERDLRADDVFLGVTVRLTPANPHPRGSVF